MVRFDDIKRETMTKLCSILNSAARTYEGAEDAAGEFNRILDGLKRDGTIHDFQVIAHCNPVYDPVAAESDSYQEYRLRSEVARSSHALREEDFADARKKSLAEPYFALFRVVVKPLCAISFAEWEFRRD